MTQGNNAGNQKAKRAGNGETVTDRGRRNILGRSAPVIDGVLTTRRRLTPMVTGYYVPSVV